MKRVSMLLDTTFKINRKNAAEINEIMKLKFINNLDNEEIAERVGQLPCKVSKRIGQGLGLLRKNFAEQGIKKFDIGIFDKID